MQLVQRVDQLPAYLRRAGVACPAWETPVQGLSGSCQKRFKTSRCTGQHSTAQHRTAQHSTAPHSTAQHSTAQHSTAQHNTAQHRQVYDEYQDPCRSLLRCLCHKGCPASYWYYCDTPLLQRQPATRCYVQSNGKQCKLKVLLRKLLMCSIYRIAR